MARSTSSYFKKPDLGKTKKIEKEAASKIKNQAPSKSSPGAKTTTKSSASKSKPLSKGMMEWAKLHQKKLTQPTAAQKKIFAQYNKQKGSSSGTTSTKAVTKPTSTKAVRSASTSTSSSKTKGDGSVKAIPVKRSGSTEVKNNKPVQAKSKPIKSNPALKSQPPKASTRRTKRVKEDPRPRGLKNNVREMKAATRKLNQKKAFTNTGIPARPSKNPKKGDVYKPPFGNVMVYNGTKWVRK
jgi:hypothetical protein